MSIIFIYYQISRSLIWIIADYFDIVARKYSVDIGKIMLNHPSRGFAHRKCY